MAQALPLVLEARRTGKIKAVCKSEDDFPAMYEVLGNAAAHEAIRQANPTGRHCELLRVNPHICTDCPVRQNPYKGDDGRDGDIYRAFEQYHHWLDDAIQLDDYNRVGLGPQPQNLSPEEFEVLRIMHRDEQLIKSQIQGQEIARIMAQIMAPFFKSDK